MLTRPALSAVLVLLGACAPEGIETASYTADTAENLPPEVSQGVVDCQVAEDGQVVWTFDVLVTDPDGTDDVLEVNAFVYDEVANERVATFQLEPIDEDGAWGTEI